MGLFSSKKKTVVGTSVMRVIKDDLLPDAIKTGVIKSILESGDISDYVMEELVGSIGLKADRMYEYAKRSYTHGLPSGQIYGASQGRPQATAILNALEGTPVLLEYLHFGPPNSLHIGWMQIMAQYGYDPVTNELPVLSAQKDKTVFLENMVVVVPTSDVSLFAPGALDQWGTPPTAGKAPSRPLLTALVGAMAGHSPVVTDDQATEDYVRVDCVWEGVTTVDDLDGMRRETTTLVRESLRIPITEAYADNMAEYFHAKYLVNGITTYWMYRVGAGTYPTLDALFNAPTPVNGSFFPFAYFRYDKRSEIEDTSTEAYKTSKKLVKYLGMDYQQVAEAINENPDIADVQQAMMIMAVPAISTNDLECRYLYSFFDTQYYAQGTRLASPAVARIWLGQNPDSKLRSSLLIQDKRFKMVLSNQGIYKRRVVGSIGAAGQHTSGTSSETRQVEYIDHETGSKYARPHVTKYHYYRQQVSANLYDEIIVTGLQMQYYVIGGYYTTGDESDDILLIPIDRSITDPYSPSDKETLYSRSLHFVINSMQIVKIKWYQQGWFQIVMIIVAVVLTVLTWGAAGPLVGAFTAATGLVVTSALLITLINLIGGFLIGMVFKLFVKLIGVDLAFLIAIVAALYGAYSAIDAGSLAGAPWAQELMQLSTSLSKAVSANVQDLFKDLLADYQTFDLFKDAAAKQLEAANNLLENKNHLSPFVIFGESPNDFYNRTVHSGNIGIQGISAISSYVDIALTLPKLDESIGENSYGEP